MNSYLTMAVVFVLGLCLGWLGNSWLGNTLLGNPWTHPVASEEDTDFITSNRDEGPFGSVGTNDVTEITRSEETGFSNNESLPNTSGITPVDTIEPAGLGTSVISRFNTLIASREYYDACLLYTSPSPRDATLSRMPSSA